MEAAKVDLFFTNNFFSLNDYPFPFPRAAFPPSRHFHDEGKSACVAYLQSSRQS
jgi:hypothetical protein